MSLSASFIRESQAKAEADDKFVLRRNALSQNPLTQVAESRDRASAIATAHVFSHTIDTEGVATSQGATGRCWMFAALNVMRNPMIKRMNLKKDFELSQAQLFFWDKLERSNWFLEQIIDTADMEVDSRLVAHLLSKPIEDGGQWDMVVGIIKKYGVMPKSAFPESKAAGSSRPLNRMLLSKLREYAGRLRSLKREDGADAETLAAAKAGMMEEVHRILLLHFGAPPAEFTWETTNSKGDLIRVPNLTPQTFLEDFAGGAAALDARVSIIHDPRHEYYKTFTVDRLGNVVGGDNNVLYLNLPIEELERLTRATLDANEPVWFGCDVGRSMHRDRGVLDLDMFDVEPVLGCDRQMDKHERVVLGDSLMTHAMVFTGYHVETTSRPWEADQADNEDAEDAAAAGAGAAAQTAATAELPVVRWRVENSWGAKGDGKGYLSMTGPWFREFVFQVVIRRQHLDERAQAALADPPTVLPAWDPYGSLA